MRGNLILLLLATTVVVAACNSVEQEADTVDDSVEFRTASDCQRIDDETEANRCYGEVAPLLLEPDVCQSIVNDSNARDACFVRVAIAAEDISVCDATLSQNQEFLANCYSGVAGVTNMPSVCEQIKDNTHKYNCYLEVAVKTANISVCEYIDNINDTFANMSVYCKSAIGHVK